MDSVLFSMARDELMDFILHTRRSFGEGVLPSIWIEVSLMMISETRFTALELMVNGGQYGMCTGYYCYSHING